jgi:hypothetical protein
MSTVAEVLQLTDELKRLVGRKREIESGIISIEAKGDRLNNERGQINRQINEKKNDLKRVVAELE